MIGNIVLSDINLYGWFFLVTLAMTGIGFIGWQLTNILSGGSLLAGGGSSRLQGLIMPRLSSNGNIEKIDDNHSSLADGFFWIFVAGSVAQIFFWVYLLNFYTGKIDFIGS